MIRTMAEIDNAIPTAYAMWKTKLFFNEEQLNNNQSKQAKRFLDAQMEFDRMPFKNQFDWQEQVSRTCPRLDRVLHEYTLGRK